MNLKEFLYKRETVHGKYDINSYVHNYLKNIGTEENKYIWKFLEQLNL